MFCKNCGERIDDNALACPRCGTSTAVNPAQPPYQPPSYQQTQFQQPPYQQQPQYQQYQQYQTTPADDNPNFGWSLLGFCFPIVGLILFLVWKDQKPLTAKSMIKAAIIGFVLFNIIPIIIGVIVAIFGGGTSYISHYTYHITNFVLPFLS